MREFKILIIVVVVIGFIYWGVEPLAHSIMHPSVSKPTYNFAKANQADLKQIKQTIKDAKANLAKAEKSNNQKAIKVAQDLLDKNETYLASLESFWGEVDISKGNIESGKELIAENCLSCHSVASQGLSRADEQPDQEAALNNGVLPPDLSNIAAVIDKNFLFHFIKNPTLAYKLWHNDNVTIPMGAYDWMEDEQIIDMVAYLDSIKSSKLSDKEAFIQACSRCHSVSYDKVLALEPKALETYLGAKAPDLSMIIRSRGEDYLMKFMNDPQKLLAGTSMPRVGVSKKAQEQIVSYLESVGDSKKEERNSLGIKIIIFFGIMSVLAYLWKKSIWRDIH